MEFSLAHKAVLGAVTLICVLVLVKVNQVPSMKPQGRQIASHDAPLPAHAQPTTPTAQLSSVRSAIPPASRPEDKIEASADDEAEQELMKELRDLRFTQPELTLELARDGNERFQETEYVAERRWFEARALVELQRFEEAQDVGRTMLDTHPESSFTADVRRHLFSHPFGEGPRYR